MAPRLELHQDLQDILGSTNVYYQIPEGFQMAYPCIVYELADAKVDHADNRPYTMTKQYEITLISRQADGPVWDRLINLPLTSFDRAFKFDGLYHYVFSTFF